LLDLAVESARLEEQNKAKRELRELLNGTVYEEKTAEIIDFIGAKSRQGKKHCTQEHFTNLGERMGEQSISY